MSDDAIHTPGPRAPLQGIWGRYRHLTVLTCLIVLQLVLIGYQMQTAKDVPFLREWAVTAVTPFARVLEFFRRNTIGFLEDYVVLTRVKEENRRLANDNARLKMENQSLKNQVASADRLKLLEAFQQKTASKTLLATVIGASTNVSAQAVYIDRGSIHGVKPGMAVITPDGIIGKVVRSFPTDSQVLLISDPGFSSAVISDRTRAHGILHGQGLNQLARVDMFQSEMDVKPGDLFFTSGNDRIFPKGMPVGRAVQIKENGGDKQVMLAPFMNQTTLEDVLVILDGVHSPLPNENELSRDIYVGPAPAPDMVSESGTADQPLRTDADRVLDRYRRAQGPGYVSPDAPLNPVAPPAGQGTTPPTGGTPTPATPGTGQPGTGQGGPLVPLPKPAPGATTPAQNANPAAPKPAVPAPKSTTPAPQTPAKPKPAPVKPETQAAAPTQYVKPKITGANEP